MGDELAGRHLIVTGASRGLGRAIALRLAAEGAQLTLVARDAAALEAVAREAEAAGGKARARRADATDAAEIGACVEAAAGEGPLWGCVHAVGCNRTGPSVDYDEADFDFLMSVNVRSAFLVLREVGRRLLEAGDGGRLLAIGSQMGSVGYPGRAAYCAAKHAVNGFVRALAVEWAAEDVTVNVLAPTFVETPMTADSLADPTFRAEVLSRIPRGRIGEQEEVAQAAAFLVGPGSGLITGAVVAADGGWTAW